MLDYQDKHPIGYTTDLSTRPQCSVPGCTNLAVNFSHKKGYYYWRRSNWIKTVYPSATDIWCCSKCHNDNTARKHGVSSSEELTAIRQGYSSAVEYRNNIHPYLRYRKDYCENVDGRLGFKCNTVLPTQDMIDSVGLTGWKPKQFLEVDHIDGNHTHNNPDNLQTLCKHCHVIKSYTHGDNLTPGRKTRDKNPIITNIYINDSTVNINANSK